MTTSVAFQMLIDVDTEVRTVGISHGGRIPTFGV
jgi:hypothetical protein